MSCLETRKQLIGLESILNDFIVQLEKENQRQSRKTIKNFFDIFSKYRLTEIFAILFISHSIIYCFIYLIGKINTRIKINFVESYSLIVTYVSILILIILLLFAEIKTLYLELITPQKLFNRLEIKTIYETIQKINSFSVKSVESFEEKIKLEVEQLNENIKDIDLYLPILIVFIILVTKYTFGIDINILFKTVNSLTGGLGLIAAISIIVKILVVQSAKKKIIYYRKFLFILKAAAIERNN